MPPDTTHIPGHAGFPSPVDTTMDPVAGGYFHEIVAQQDVPQYLLPQSVMFFLILAGLLVLYVFFNRKSLFANGRSKRERYRLANNLLERKGQLYHDWLCQFNPYYQSLSKDLQQRFLFRLAQFMQTKTFRYHSLKHEEYIPVLISAAAIQLTFGLKNYLMDYFSIIHVMGNEYIRKHDPAIYLGHVSHTGIHIAWNYFVKGYANYKDHKNLGLHEMAHAVSLDVFFGQQDRHDRKFRQRFEGFSFKGKPVFRALRKGDTRILDDYATINFDEFWAVCIETFFENGEELKENETDLYICICEVLNQDPLTTGKIIDLQIAGD